MRVAPHMRGPLPYLGVALVMMSNLMLELLLTRIFSATMWYHFAFMAVSIALFGTTVGAVVVHLWPQRFPEADGWRLSARYALAYAASIVVCTVVQLRLNVTFGMAWSELASVTALYVLIAIPFALSGVFMCLALLRAGERVGAVYGADLIGAAAGCALFVPFAACGDGPRGVLLLAALAALGAALVARAASDRRTMVVAALAVAFCTGTFVGRFDRAALRVHWAKGHRDVAPVIALAPGSAHAFEAWNAFSRLLVDPIQPVPLGWGMGARFVADQYVDQEFLTIDGTAATIMTRFDGDLTKLKHLQWDATALVHAIRPHGPVLIIGVGGGRDILTALTFGHQRVVGVEVNGGILGLLRGPFADFTGHLERRADVELVHDEARSYAARTPERFEVIQAALVDTWAGAANGAYVMSENALYTREGVGVFLDRLAPDGVLSLSRWYFGSETLRLLSLASAALRQRGVVRVQDHLFLAHNLREVASVATILIKTVPFTVSELQTLREWCAAKGFEEILGPGTSRDETLAQLAGAREPTALLAAYPFDISAPTDDRPFFFNMLRLRNAFWRSGDQGDASRPNTSAVVTLAWLFVVVVALSAMFILGPLWLRRASGAEVPHAASRIVYFAGLGLGFIMIELSLMQRLMITLGHPMYGLTVVLFALLVSAGLGSFWTQRAVGQGGAAAWLRLALLSLLLVAACTALGGAALAAALEGAPTWVRITGSVMLLLPLGFFMGMPLATGLVLSAGDPPGYRALYWGVNGAASVCGSVLATMLSLAWGMAATFAVGVGMYAVCLGAARVAFARATPAMAVGLAVAEEPQRGVAGMDATRQETVAHPGG